MTKLEWATRASDLTYHYVVNFMKVLLLPQCYLLSKHCIATVAT